MVTEPGDPGAVGNGYQEWESARQFNNHLAKHLKALGQKVTIYNSKGTISTTKDMYQQTAKGQGLWVFTPNNRIIIETHLNSATKTANGTETLIGVSLTADKYDKAMNKALTEFFHNRGIKKRADLLNINVAQQRGLNYRLNELCFISNKNDIATLTDEMDKIAAEMAKKLTGKVIPSEPPKKPSEAIGWAYFMGKSENIVKVEIFPWDLYLKKYNNLDKFAHEIKIVTSSKRAIYNDAGKIVGYFSEDSGSRLMYINTELENKMKREEKA